MGALTSKHDTFIRAIMANQGIALDYFRASLPEYVLDKLDFSTFKQLADTYISKELRKSVSDIVYSCQRRDRKGEVKVSLLIEHKSYIDKYTPIQVGSYIFSGLLKQIGNGESPSLIIPILLYHGKVRWEYKTLVELFSDLEPELQKFVPDYQYVYYNLGQISDNQIEALHNKFLAASLLALKYSLLDTELKSLIPTILTLAEGVDANLQSSLIVYTFVSSGLNQVQITDLLEKLPIQIKETVMNTLDIFVEKGEKKRAEKVVRNLIRLSILNDEQIAVATELPVDYVASIRKELESGK